MGVRRRRLGREVVDGWCDFVLFGIARFWCAYILLMSKHWIRACICVIYRSNGSLFPTTHVKCPCDHSTVFDTLSDMYIYCTVCHFHHYHPLLVNSLTLLVTLLNPILNLARHLSLFNLFLFSPPRSWYRCFCCSRLILFLATKLPNMPIPRTKSLPRLTSSSTVRPYVAFKRGYMANVSFCCVSRFAASLGLLDWFGSSMSVGRDMASKFSFGARSAPRRKLERRDEGSLKPAPKTELARAAARTSLPDVDCPRGA
jgi:hypothetical protein